LLVVKIDVPQQLAECDICADFLKSSQLMSAVRSFASNQQYICMHHCALCQQTARAVTLM